MLQVHWLRLESSTSSLARLDAGADTGAFRGDWEPEGKEPSLGHQSDHLVIDKDLGDYQFAFSAAEKKPLGRHLEAPNGEDLELST